MPLANPPASQNQKPAMKRIIICCDGTWQDSDGGEPEVPTNVTRITRALKSCTADGISQVVYYQSGVGTGGAINKLIGGGTGDGLSENVRDAYGFLAHNFHLGDTIHLIGFSRGAYTARSICGLICRIGVLTKKGMDNFYNIYAAYRDRKLRDPAFVKELWEKDGGTHVIPHVKVKTIACWDTVGSLGIPNLGIPLVGNVVGGVQEDKYGFHDTDLSDLIENAFHALALDEHRGPFTPTLWFIPKDNTTTNLKQVWFPGVHSNIGGGYKDQEIADITLAWVIQQLHPFLEFDDSYLHEIIRNSDDHSSGEWAAGKVYNSATKLMRIVAGYYRTPGEYGGVSNEFIHKCVRVRMKVVPGWKSKALNGWEWVEEGENGVWKKGEKVLKEDELGHIEKHLAGEKIVERMLEELPKASGVAGNETNGTGGVNGANGANAANGANGTNGVHKA